MRHKQPQIKGRAERIHVALLFGASACCCGKTTTAYKSLVVAQCLTQSEMTPMSMAGKRSAFDPACGSGEHGKKVLPLTFINPRAYVRLKFFVISCYLLVFGIYFSTIEIVTT